MEYYYWQGRSNGWTNDHGNNNEGATTCTPLPAPSRDNNAAPLNHLLRLRRCWGSNVATPALRSCWGVNNGKEGQWAMAVLGVPWSCQRSNIRAVVGQKSGIGDVGCWARLSRGRKATASGLKKEVTINLLLGGRVWSTMVDVV